MLNQRVEEGLDPGSYYSHLQSSAERRYSTYRKECLAVLFGCLKCRSYLEHKEFEFQYDNLAVYWILQTVKDIGRLRRWVLRLDPLKFRVKHTRGIDNVVPVALSRVFEGKACDGFEMTCTYLIESPPLFYTSLTSIDVTTHCLRFSRLIFRQLNLRQRSSLYI